MKHENFNALKELIERMCSAIILAAVFYWILAILVGQSISIYATATFVPVLIGAILYSYHKSIKKK